jgi:PKD repeat protein
MSYGNDSKLLTLSDMTEKHRTLIPGALLALVILFVTATQLKAYPVAVVAADPLAGFAPLTVEFDGSDSWDTLGLHVTKYTWNFNDGSPVIEGSDLVRVKHVFHNPGIYPVYLTVYNKFGHSKTAQQQIKVSAVPISR